MNCPFLAAFFLELTIWAEIKIKVRAQVWDQFEDEIEDNIVENLDEDLDEQVNLLLRSQAWAQLGGQIDSWVWEQIEDHNLDLTELLNHLQFSSDFRKSNFKDSLKEDNQKILT
ncbi:MAG: hypothetical protein AB8G05_19425 [Oligoflexales bacterium]